MAEAVHFLKKAKQQLDHARFVMDNTDFSLSEEILNPVDNHIAEISRMIVETRRAVELAAARISGQEEKIEERMQERNQ